MPFSLVLLPLVFADLVAAAAVVPASDGELISYQPEPNMRGTVGVIVSCAVTLFLCIWTALHLNIEPLEFSYFKYPTISRIVGKAIWALTALIAPELVLCVALHQFLIARRHLRELRSVNTGRKDGQKARFLFLD